MVLRIGADGHAIKEGSQVQIGGNDRYTSVCRLHFKEGLSDSRSGQLRFEI
jgi:thymidine kinase